MPCEATMSRVQPDTSRRQNTRPAAAATAAAYRTVGLAAAARDRLAGPPCVKAARTLHRGHPPPRQGRRGVMLPDEAGGDPAGLLDPVVRRKLQRCPTAAPLSL